jgi:DNA replicative helicase MCM subunit Mcm2 (Cdc46/Mcm family)
VRYGREHREISWGESARELWVEVYGGLSEGKPGLFGAATSRAEAQTVRLASLYATLDRSRTIERSHLEAALALWRYAEASALFIFGDATGDAVADRIAAALEEESDGLTRTDLFHVFGRHRSRDRIDEALALLERLGRVRSERAETGGRPAERWFLD